MVVFFVWLLLLACLVVSLVLVFVCMLDIRVFIGVLLGIMFVFFISILCVGFSISLNFL